MRLKLFFILFMLMIHVSYAQYQPTYDEDDRNEAWFDVIWDILIGFSWIGLILIVIVFFALFMGWIRNKTKGGD